MVVGEVRFEDRVEVGLGEDDWVVEAVASNGAHKALREWILPRRLRRGLDLFDAKACEAVPKPGPVDGIAVTQQVARGGVFGSASTICGTAHSALALEVQVPVHDPASVDREPSRHGGRITSG